MNRPMWARAVRPMCRPPRWILQRLRTVAAGDRGAGTVLALAVVGAVVALAVGVIPALTVLVDSQRAENAADAAALAAADARSGAVSGVPCELAGAVAVRNGAELVSCEIDDGDASVEVRRHSGLFPVGARARAGPPRT